MLFKIAINNLFKAQNAMSWFIPNWGSSQCARSSAIQKDLDRMEK